MEVFLKRCRKFHRDVDATRAGVKKHGAVLLSRWVAMPLQTVLRHLSTKTCKKHPPEMQGAFIFNFSRAFFERCCNAASAKLRIEARNHFGCHRLLIPRAPRDPNSFLRHLSSKTARMDQDTCQKRVVMTCVCNSACVFASVCVAFPFETNIFLRCFCWRVRFATPLERDVQFLIAWFRPDAANQYKSRGNM